MVNNIEPSIEIDEFPFFEPVLSPKLAPPPKKEKENEDEEHDE